jgi:SAM-dependent methyltransferase
MAGERKHSLLEVVGVAALVAALAVLLYRDWVRETGEAEPLTAATEEDARRMAFERAYSQGQWGRSRDGRGSSGEGSTLESTRLYRVFLQDFLAAQGIRSVVDAGCGDWEFSRAIDWKGVDYLGLDIVAPVIETNRRRYGAANVRFAVADIVRDDLPPADLLLVKDVLQHLSHADIASFLKQLPRYRHVLIVNDVLPGSLTAQHADIATGGYRPIDLTQPPHSLRATKVLAYQVGSHTKLVLHLQPGPATSK